MNEDEAPILQRKILGEDRCGAGVDGHLVADTPTFLGRGQDLHCVGRPAARTELAELCRKEGIAQSLYYTWS
jgi:hypothetical protein